MDSTPIKTAAKQSGKSRKLSFLIGFGAKPQRLLPYLVVYHIPPKRATLPTAVRRSGNFMRYVTLCDRISHQFTFFIIFLPHSGVIIFLVKVESHPPLRKCLRILSPPPPHAKASIFLFSSPSSFISLPHENEKRRSPSHHGTGAFRMAVCMCSGADALAFLFLLLLFHLLFYKFRREHLLHILRPGDPVRHHLEDFHEQQ